MLAWVAQMWSGPIRVEWHSKVLEGPCCPEVEKGKRA